MKYFILLLSFLFFSSSANELNMQTETILQKEQNNIMKALEIIKNSPNKELYDIYSGNNPSKKPIRVEFMDLAILNHNYSNYDSIGWKRKNKLYIYINIKHTNAPIEALAALIAGRIIHVDDYDSYNEEIYAWVNEGLLWRYLTLENPELSQVKHKLVVREEVIKKIIEADYSLKYLEKFIYSNKGYHGFNKTSPNYSNEELNIKLEKLLKCFNLEKK